MRHLQLFFEEIMLLFVVSRKYSSIAQSVECVTVNHRVVGSSPTWGANREVNRNKGVIAMFNSFKKVKENSKRFSNMNLNRVEYAPWHIDGNKYTTIVRTIGINPEDVKVEHRNNVISVSGKSVVHGDEYSTGFDIPLSDVFVNRMESVTHETVNGLTFIVVELKAE